MAAHKPSSHRPYGLRAAMIGVLSVAVLAGAPLARADDLNDQKTATQVKIDANRAQTGADQTKLDAAAAALQQAQQDLAAAQADLDAKQQATQQARAEDARLAGLLGQARRALAARQADQRDAQAAVDANLADMAAQRDQIALAVQTSAQQNTTLLSLSILLTNFDSAQINNRVQWASLAFEASQHAMDLLQAAQVKLAAAEAAAERATQAADDAATAAQGASDAAAAHLAVTLQAQADAEAAQRAVADKVAASQQAQKDAQAAIDADNAEQKALQQQLAQIQADIKAQIAAQQKAGTPAGTQSSSSGAFFYRPVQGRITSPYGWRIHPILHTRTFHDGVDFSAGCGTAVHAAESGTITKASWNGAYGNYVLINHGVIDNNYWSTGYGHLSSYAVGVGQHVSRGQVIGYAGTTGLSTGCHLHFHTFENGATVNPAPLVS